MADISNRCLANSPPSSVPSALAIHLLRSFLFYPAFVVREVKDGRKASASPPSGQALASPSDDASKPASELHEELNAARTTLHETRTQLSLETSKLEDENEAWREKMQVLVEDYNSLRAEHVETESEVERLRRENTELRAKLKQE